MDIGEPANHGALNRKVDVLGSVSCHVSAAESVQFPPGDSDEIAGSIQERPTTVSWLNGCCDLEELCIVADVNRRGHRCRLLRLRTRCVGRRERQDRNSEEGVSHGASLSASFDVLRRYNPTHAPTYLHRGSERARRLLHFTPGVFGAAILG